MRILHTGDWHLGKNLEGVSRMDEQEEFLKDFVKIVEENKIDLIIIAGDIYDSSNPPARAEKMFYDTLKKLSPEGDRLILVIAGNHDNPERLVAAGPLACDHGIIMCGKPKSVIRVGKYGKHKVLESKEGFIELEINNERASILNLPYPSEKRLNEVIYDFMSEEEEKVKSYGERIKALFNNLKNNFKDDTINLVVSHIFAMGSVEAGSERSIQLGGSYIIDGNCFPKEAQYIALGHIHKPQIVPGTNKKARYCGSPIHYSKKEINFDKKCFIIDVKAKEEAIISEVMLKVYKPIEIWKCSSVNDAIRKCEENKGVSSYVYIEIESDTYIQEDEIKKMKSFKDDILAITPIIKNINYVEDEFVNINEKSFTDIFKEFYKKERNVDVDKELLELLMSIVEDSDKEDKNEAN